MSYTYSDSTMMIATQLAYLDFNGNNENAGEYVDSILETYGECVNGEWVLREDVDWSARQKAEFGTAKTIMDITSATGGSEEWRTWNVVDVCNDQDSTGYYAVVIDTGDRNAIIGCRGSESTDPGTAYKDWGEADLGLLDRSLTYQQEKAEEYMERIWHKYGDQYDSFSVTGHSLGGNLAEHMVIAAPAAIREKIEHCISFDGPGYSDEYIATHADDIAKASHLIDHYQWSFVSSLLSPLPGVRDTIIKAHDDERQKNPLMAMVHRHATYNVEFDENGNIIEGDESDLSKITGPLSRFVDRVSLLDLKNDITWLQYLESMGIPTRLFSATCEFFIGVKLISQAMYTFKEGVQQLSNLKNNIYYKYIAPQISGDYEVANTNLIRSMAAEIQSAESRLQMINNEIEDIRRNLKYWSAMGGYYRSQLFIIRNGFEGDLGKLKKMEAVADNAATKYDDVDSKVEKYFEGK